MAKRFILETGEIFRTGVEALRSVCSGLALLRTFFATARGEALRLGQGSAARKRSPVFSAFGMKRFGREATQALRSI